MAKKEGAQDGVEVDFDKINWNDVYSLNLSKETVTVFINNVPFTAKLPVLLANAVESHGHLCETEVAKKVNKILGLDEYMPFDCTPRKPR